MPPITNASSENVATVNRLLAFVLYSLEKERRSVETAPISDAN